MENIFGFGKRIIEERETTKLNQTAFGAIGGKSRNVQIRYEHEETEPPISYLIKLAKIGVDIQYIVTGVRSTQALSEDIQELIELYIKADISKKASIIAVARSSASDISEAKTTRTFGKIIQYNEGDGIYNAADKKDQGKED